MNIVSDHIVGAFNRCMPVNKIDVTIFAVVILNNACRPQLYFDNCPWIIPRNNSSSINGCQIRTDISIFNWNVRLDENTGTQSCTHQSTSIPASTAVINLKPKQYTGNLNRPASLKTCANTNCRFSLVTMNNRSWLMSYIKPVSILLPVNMKCLRSEQKLIISSKAKKKLVEATGWKNCPGINNYFSQPWQCSTHRLVRPRPF